jgi:hypothetical protein
MSPMRRLRFAVWVVSVVGVLLFNARSNFWPSIGCLFVIWFLLCTTPVNAIRLPRWVSEIFILVSTLAIDSHRAVLPLEIHFNVLVAMLILLRLWGKSPWWAVLYGWFPVSQL